jgi:hypothetical protein
MAFNVAPVHGKNGAVYLLKPTATPGTLALEACTESGATAQITDIAKRLLDPNNPPVFTDDGGAQVVEINYTNGTARFAENVGIVTVTGTNCYYPATELTKVGYVKSWSFDISLDLADASYMGTNWKSNVAGQSGGTGSVETMFIGDQALIDGIENKELFLFQLFTYDPDQDQTGDNFLAWAWFTSTAISATVGDIVKETTGFTLEGAPSVLAAT